MSLKLVLDLKHFLQQRQNTDSQTVRFVLLGAVLKIGSEDMRIQILLQLFFRPRLVRIGLINKSIMSEKKI